MKPTKTGTAANTAISDRYIRSEDFAARIDGIELPPEIWAVFAQLNKARSIEEIARTLKLDTEAVHAAVRRLVRRKIVRKHVVAWRDYAAAASPDSPPAAHSEAVRPPAPEAPLPFPVQNAPEPTARLPRSSPPAPAAVAAPIVKITTPPPAIVLRLDAATPTSRPSPAISLRIAASKQTAPAPTPAKPATTQKQQRLRPILDAIGAKAGGGIAGQLLVYRVFLQIPTALMHDAGLHSLSLVDDNFTISNTGLRTALAEAARTHAGLDIENLNAA